MKNFILFFTIFIITISQHAQAQFGFECGFSDSSGALNSSIFGSSFYGLKKPIRTDLSGDSLSPVNAVFPIIIVFVQFKNDNDDWQWPSNQAPLYLDSLISPEKRYNSDWWDAYDENTEQFSDYWLEVSRGKFHVTGKAFSVVLDKFEYEYTSDHEINLEIWSKIDSGISDWRDFDKWRDTLINNQMKFYYESDGYVDMIYKVHKRYGGPLWNKRGYAHLTSSQFDTTSVLVDTLNNVRVGNGYRGKGSGVTASFSARKFHNMLVLQHEHGHCLYANGHITYGKVSYGPGGDGFFSPYEMILLNYQNADTVNFVTQNNYYLADYSARSNTNGEILRVPIQGEECFLITNRSNVSKWDKIMLGDTIQTIGPYDYSGDYGKGIYINHIKSTGIFFPNGNNFHVQDLECADGVWHWSYKGQKQRYAWDAGYCFDGGLWNYYLRDSVSYDNDGGWNLNSADARSYSYTIWAGIGKNDGCPMGTDRVFTNSEEIYANEEVLGDRYDAWNVGYNEIFSPYSSPNTNTMSNSSSGIYIWLYSNSGSGPTSSAAFKIYKTGEGGYTDSSILQITPPSKPMGLVVDYHLETENIMRPILTWNHNREPDMLNTSNNKKKYKIWRATSTSMSVVPTNYSLHNIVEIDSGTAPSYIDTTIYAIGSGWPGIGNTAEYPVRYKIQAVDKYQDSSVRSDFDMGIGLIPNVGCPLCTEGPDSFISDTEIPKEFKLYSNYPNPFNPVTNIKFDLPKDVQVSIKIYDIVGREVKTLVNEFKTAGRYSVTFSGSDFASGVYYYKIKSGEFEQVRKMILLK